jgi:transcriptional regulator with XRE-family HTH domain
MSVTLDSERLRRELVRRGWNATELAQAARVSNATVSAACRGRAISPTSVRLIVKALMSQPPLPDIDIFLS